MCPPTRQVVIWPGTSSSSILTNCPTSELFSLPSLPSFCTVLASFDPSFLPVFSCLPFLCLIDTLAFLSGVHSAQRVQLIHLHLCLVFTACCWCSTQCVQFTHICVLCSQLVAGAAQNVSNSFTCICVSCSQHTTCPIDTLAFLSRVHSMLLVQHTMCPIHSLAFLSRVHSIQRVQLIHLHSCLVFTACCWCSTHRVQFTHLHLCLVFTAHNASN